MGPISISKSNDGSYKGSIKLAIGKEWTITAEALAPSKNAYVRAEQTIEVSSNASPVKLVLEPAPEYPIFLVGDSTSWGSAKEALTLASKDRPAIIVITENFAPTSTINLNPNNEMLLYITSQGPAKTLTFDTTTADNHAFNISSGGSLNLSNIIIQGSESDALGRLIYLNGGSCTLGNGAVLTGNINTSATDESQGGGVYIASGSFIMEEGSKIENCSSYYGGGVCGNPTDGANLSIEINKGTINNCEAREIGGGIYFRNGFGGTSTFTATGGSITNCIANGFSGGGGMFIDDYSTVNLSDFTIKNCKAENSQSASGGGIFFYLDITANLVNCKIDSCSAAANGGGIYVDPSTKLILKDSSITACKAEEKGGGIYLNAATIEFNCPANYTVFSDNDSSNHAKNLHGEGNSPQTSTGYIKRINNSDNPGDTEIQAFLISISGGVVNTGNFGTYFAFGSP